MNPSHIENPLFNKLSFPLSKQGRLIDFCLLYTEIYKAGGQYGHDDYIRDMEPEEINALCQKVKEELKLVELDWGYVGGRCLVWCSIEDKNRVYDIVNAFLEKGCRIYMNDKSEVTFCPGEHACAESQQRKIIQSFQRLLRYEEDRPVLRHVLLSTQLPLSQDSFWTIDEGPEFASKLREVLLC